MRKIYLFIFYGYLCDYIKLCVSHMCIACGGPERASHSMKLQLPIVVNCQMLVQKMDLNPLEE